MDGSKGFDPSREWLGIPAVDLADPFRVLGLPADEADAAAVHAAADRLLGRLREIDPGPFRVAHASLQRRIEACRSEALAATAARNDAMPRPPDASVPALPARDAIDAAAKPEASLDTGIRLHRPRRHPSKSKSPVPAMLSMLAAVAAVVAAYVVWPQTPAGGGKMPRLIADVIQQPTPRDNPPEVAARMPVEPAPQSADAAPPPRTARPVAAAHTPPEPAAPAEPDPTPEPAPTSASDATAPETAEPSHEPPSGVAPMPVTTDAWPPVDGPPQPDPGQPDHVTADVDARLRSALQAMRRGEFDTADRETEAANRLVEDDERLADRVACWLQLARYARKFSAFRAKALLAAPDNCEVAGTHISIVESTPAVFKFKAAGRIHRIPPADVPPAIVDVLVRRWFAAKDQPGNHVFLGCHLILLDPPDVDAAREEWAIAKRGGQDVTLLEPLIDDPLIRVPRQ